MHVFPVILHIMYIIGASPDEYTEKHKEASDTLEGKVKKAPAPVFFF